MLLNLTNSTSDLSSLFFTAVEDTFAELAFLEAMENKYKLPVELSPQKFLACKIDVLSPYQGKLMVQIQKNLVEEIARIFFSPEEITEQLKSDMVCELLNTLVGRLMRGICTENQLFSLGLPNIIIDKEAKQLNSLNQVFHNEYLVNDQFVVLTLYIN